MIEAINSRSAARAMFLATGLACASCATASVITPTMRDEASFAGETACLVRGLGGPLTSYVGAGRELLRALGFRVVVREMTVSPKDLQSCAVIVAHSAGAVPALATVGRRVIFIIDGFASLLQRCPTEATCTNFFNPGDMLSGRLAGAQNINCLIECGTLDAIPGLAHMTMPASREVWRTISRQLAQRPIVVAANGPAS